MILEGLILSLIVDTPYLWPKVLSLGDLFLMVGVFLFIQQIMMDTTLFMKIEDIKIQDG